MLFLDEPSTGLDPQNRAHLWDHVRGLRDQGTTIFLTTHYLEEADALCDRLVIMDHGEIVIEGTPRELKRQVAGESVVLSLHDEDGGASSGLGAPGRPGRSYARSASTVTRSACTSRTRAPTFRCILRLLDAEHIGIKAMSVSEPTLDDVFLRQTGRSLREAGRNRREEGQHEDPS